MTVRRVTPLSCASISNDTRECFESSSASFGLAQVSTRRRGGVLSATVPVMSTVRASSTLSDDIGSDEVVARDAKVIDGSAKRRECRHNSRRIRWIGLYQNIEVAGRAGNAMNSKRMRPNDKEYHLMGNELAKHVAKIIDHRSSFAPCWRNVDNLTGISFRE